MADNKKDLLEELAENGLSDEWIERIRNWNDASPLRKVASSAEKRAKEAEERAAKFRGVALKQAFQEAGIRINPALLNIPDDLDILDQAVVTKWATDNGLRDNSPSVEQSELEAHEEVNNLNSGGEPPSSSVITPIQASEWTMDRSMKFAAAHPEAWEELKRGNEVRNLSTTS